MKNVILSLFIIISCSSVIGQQLTQQDYIKKSKDQKTFSTILPAGGGLLVLGGIISYASTSSYFPGETVGTISVICGSAAITGGILLSSASKKNERRAKDMSSTINLKFENSEAYKFTNERNKYFPALSLKLSFK